MAMAHLTFLAQRCRSLEVMISGWQRVQVLLSASSRLSPSCAEGALYYGQRQLTSSASLGRCLVRYCFPTVTQTQPVVSTNSGVSLSCRAIEAAGPSRPPLEQGGLGSEVPDGRIAPAGASAAEEHPQHLKGGLQQEQRQQEQQQQRRHREQQQQSGWQSTVNRREAEKFAKFSDEWWAPEGPFKPLHRMNPTRVRFITGALCDNFGLDAYQPEPLASLRVLDIGCGGGILAESLARQGAQVTGVDVNEAAVGAAEAHALQDQLVAARLQYRVAAAEQLVQEGRLFDAVIASEVIEHVTSLPHFCASLAHLTKPGGAVVVTTLNRTPRSLALAVVAAEYVLRWVPAGTHDWSKFLTPEELSMVMADGSGGAVTLEQLAGMQYNPLTGQWSLGTDTAINYAAYFRKQG